MDKRKLFAKLQLKRKFHHSSKAKQISNDIGKIDKNRKSNNQDKRFKYGNYNRYYGYRNENKDDDQRIQLLEKEWFENKSCLDIGCNVGHLTLWIAKHFHPSKMKGVDIDTQLVKSAKNNIVHYIEETALRTKANEGISNAILNVESENISSNNDQGQTKNEKNHENNTNYSNSSNIGNSINGNNETVDTSLSSDIMETINRSKNNEQLNPCNNDCQLDSGISTNEVMQKILFPYNVSFITENYAPASPNVLKYVKSEEYDIILCLSVTKWIQLNYGDDSLKMTFKKIYKQLKPSGKFILEPQPYQSYKRRKNLTDEIRKNYDDMKFFPEDYISYLTSDEVGFSSYKQLDLIKHNKQGFQRPIYLLKKS